MKKADIGLVGLGVMGRMLALNIERHGYCVAGYDVDEEKVNAFEADRQEKALIGCRTLGDFIAALDKPRRIMLMVPAGAPVDAVIEEIKFALEPGDLLIDGGNSFFQDTERRARDLEPLEVLYMGTGVSGGEYGALWGPSIMPGGQPEAWTLVKPIFEAIAARVDDEPCVTYVGRGGAGHYVKMVHNGIEYGDMQLIAEAYDLLHRAVGLSAEELASVFSEWNKGELESYLIEITADIFTKRDTETGKPLVDVILDTAQQKGTGKWTSQNALDLGAPTPTLNAAVEARIISAYREERVAASQVLAGPEVRFEGDRGAMIVAVRDALYTAKLCSYAQGFALLRAASQEYGYGLHYGELARIWRGGCIIRARFLNDVRAAFGRDPALPNLLMDSVFSEGVNARQDALRQVVQLAVAHGVPAPAFSSALAYYDAYRSARLPANLTQAQRDYFGAHTYQRVDKAGKFHTEWIES
ncbi:MAG: NADP-dependent phosphogluconate dehydrogenase [Anaerolineae bacterium]|jgi:6-phosphogluconate dehydrogenase|nr:NADP-dependent phosphogluconate dehydrogenase [Anaerolineae bacterium]